MKIITEIKLKTWQQILIGVVFFLVGIGMLLYSSITTYNYNKKNKTYKETVGTVVKYNYNEENLQAIVVEYKIKNDVYEKASSTYSNFPKSIGEKVELKYNPKNPEEAIWVEKESNIIIVAIGAIFTILGVVYTITTLKIKDELQTV